MADELTDFKREAAEDKTKQNAHNFFSEQHSSVDHYVWFQLGHNCNADLA